MTGALEVAVGIFFAAIVLFNATIDDSDAVVEKDEEGDVDDEEEALGCDEQGGSGTLNSWGSTAAAVALATSLKELRVVAA